MQKLLILAFIMVAYLATMTFAAKSCIYKFEGGSDLDFAHLGTIKGQFQQQEVLMNLCENIPECSQTSSSICVPKAGTRSDISFASKDADATPAVTVYDSSTKVSTIKEESGRAQCFSSGLQPRKLAINIKCGSKVSPTFEITELGSCQFETSIEVKCGGNGSGLSGGGIFLIILFSALAAYFLIGFIVCKFVLKKQGVEAIPQGTFWCALPGLYIAGIKCVIGKITGKGGSSSNNASHQGYGATEEV